MSEWKKYKLGNLINVKHGFAFKGEFFSDQPTQDILLTPGNFKIGGGFKADKFKYYNGDYPADYILKEGDILITMTDLSKAGDTLGYSAKIPKHSGIKYLHNQRLGLVQFKSDEIDPDFLYWVLRTKPYQFYIVGSATGSTVKHTSPTRICSYEFQAPKDIEEQRQIAQILTSLDDKIELNLQMNQTLEAMAQAIFKEWFVNFNFPGFDGELVDGLPKGWRMGVLSDVIEFTNGFAFKSTDLLDYPEDDCYHVFKMGNINKGGGFNYEGTKSYFKKADADKLGKYILRKGDLLMCMTDMKDNVALLGHTALMNQDDKFLVNQRVGLLRPNNKLSIDYPYLYILTNYPEFIKELRSRANRGVQVNLSTSEIKNTKIVIPEKNVNVQFDELAKPVFEKIFANIENIQELTQTRDTLLPKLISGQLEVV
jgi:type I restriction enzyme S subunit